MSFRRWHRRVCFSATATRMRHRLMRLRGVRFALLVVFAYMGSTVLTLFIKSYVIIQPEEGPAVPMAFIMGRYRPEDNQIASAAELVEDTPAMLQAVDDSPSQSVQGIPSLDGSQQYVRQGGAGGGNPPAVEGPLVPLEAPSAPDLPPAVAAQPTTPAPPAPDTALSPPASSDTLGGAPVNPADGVVMKQENGSQAEAGAKEDGAGDGLGGGNVIFEYNRLQYATTETSFTNNSDPGQTRFIPGNMIEDDPNIKTILFWNSFFTSMDYRFGTGHEPFTANKCPVDNCQTTTDRSWLDRATAVMLHGPWIEEQGPMPDHRVPGQLYIYIQNEPQNIVSKQVLSRYRNMFNITVSNRVISDVRLPYGWVAPSSRPWLKSKYGGIFVSPAEKPRDVVWMVSHCETPGRREMYVSELQKHVEVDVYGQCGTFSCTQKSETCLAMFAAKYKFYLAMENDYCSDYISEKLFRTLDYEMIPIVYGGGNYSREAPPHSVINVDDYPNPKDLADYLHYLGGNSTAYNEYFLWRTKYEVVNFRRTIYAKTFCELCEILNNPNYEMRTEEYRAIDTWWLTDNCDSSHMSKVRAQYLW